ncbi:MAG TPA: adenylate/guanylate cyclase domain-containing protein [Acidimicrobiia bacterium]|nr:adenylate/guanylate cyclase domain-containing protein [Acidimicrobiia bacterium]
MTTRGRSGRPQTLYAETNLGYVGYQVIGEGERDIMFITGALSNADAIWDEPSAARFFDRLANMGRVIRYDMRGSGVSDPVPNRNMWMTIEENVDDVRAVLDAAGSDQAVIYGDTEGGLSGMMLAATDPERVSALVLVNAVPHLLREDDYPIGAPLQAADALSKQYVAQHGTTSDMLELTAPSVANDLRFRNWWTRYQRMSVPLGLVKTTFDWFAEVDVRAALPLITVPTLVVARRDAKFHRLAFGEYIAKNISGAELRIVEGADTLPFHAGDFGPTLDSVEEFLTGRKESSRADRVLATVLFTDIVGSTALASTLGDVRWLDLLEEHNRIVRAQLERFRGKEIKMTGDGCVATFDGPARAVACALGIVEQVSAIGLELRAGIHTGEVELRGGDIGGVGVHIASRVMSQAETGGILASGTVKDLVVGSGIDFIPCGSFDLKGVPGNWQLYEPKVR